MIALGQHIIIVDDKVLKVDPWIQYHPGGSKAIMHMVGRDATDEVTAYVAFVLLVKPLLITGESFFQCLGCTQRKLDSR